MYLGRYFSVFGKQLDLLGIKFFNFTFWECILSFWERDSIYWLPSSLICISAFSFLGNDLINQKKSRSSNSSWEAIPVAGRLVSTFHLAMHSSWGENDHCWLVILRFEHSNIASVGLTLLPSLLKALLVDFDKDVATYFEPCRRVQNNRLRLRLLTTAPRNKLSTKFPSNIFDHLLA